VGNKEEITLQQTKKARKGINLSGLYKTKALEIK
jgi:hypothetical protein